MLDSGFPGFWPGKTNSEFRAADSSLTIAGARLDSATRCSRRAFIRSAGIVQSVLRRPDVLAVDDLRQGGRPAESVPAQFAVDDLHQTTSKLLDGVFVHLKKDNPSRVAFQQR